ncbi:MAG: hypothetical protein QW103_01255 [Candidatus Pacearchaeota archaeon]
MNEKDKTNIGLLIQDNKKTWRSYKERAELGRKRGVYLFYIDVNELEPEKIYDEEKIKCKYWDGKSMIEKFIEFPKVVYDRTRPGLTNKNIETILETIKEKNFAFINSPDFRKLCYDKWKTYSLLEKKDIKQPKTKIYSDENLEEMINNYQFVFIKKRNSSQGKNQIIIKNLENRKFRIILSDYSPSFFQEEDYSFIRRKMKELEMDDKFIIQEGVKVDRIDERFYDLRVIFQRDGKGKFDMTCFYVRVGAISSEQANISKKGHPQDPNLFFEYPFIVKKDVVSFSKK